VNFHAAIHSFEMGAQHPENNSFFASLENRKELLNAIKNQMKSERGSESMGEEKGDKLLAYFKIARNNFLGDIQEYTSALDHSSLEAIYMGMEQTRFNHLIEIRNNIGIYLPVFFFFPLRIAIKQNALPIFVGSSVKLATELAEIQTTLKPNEKVKLGDFPQNFEANEEDVEDYEADHEGVENFWACFNYIVLDSLVKKSLQEKLPIFIF
jgi:hypothetical protein